MPRENLSPVNVKDGVENPGCIGLSLLTAGQELWRERVMHEKNAVQRSRDSMRSPNSWKVPDGDYKSALQAQNDLREKLRHVSQAPIRAPLRQSWDIAMLGHLDANASPQ